MQKTITPHYEQIGKRRKLVGFRAVIIDGDMTVYDRVHDNQHEAALAIDGIAYEYLISEPAVDLDGNLETERTALYAIEEPTQAQWKRLHELDLTLGY